jgi:tetratricopeptide (TPR) repeat protein
LKGKYIDPAQAFARAAAFHAEGRLREAEELYDAVLAADARHFEAVYRMGLIRLQQGRFADAEALFRRAVKLDKRSHDAHHYLAIALTGLHRLEEAIPSYAKALALRPNYAEAHNNLGHALQLLNRHGEAAAHCKKALAINPSYAEAHNNLGNALAALERIEEAIAHYREALAINAAYAEAHLNIANALMALGRPEEAIPHCEQALAQRSNYLDAHLTLSAALIALDRPEEAIKQYEKALVIDHARAETHTNLGRLILELGRPQEAVAHFRRALVVDPDFAQAYNGLGTALQALGDLDEAIAAFKKASAVDPRRTRAYLNLALATRLTADDPCFLAMRELARDIKSLDPDDQVSLRFALGKALADLGQHEASFQELIEGNRLKRQQLCYDEPTRMARFDRIRAVFTAELLRENKGLGDPSRVPVFIVGMPRSGTTLVEQILASHPQVYGAGEISEFGKLAGGMRGANGSEFPECAAPLSGEQLRGLGTRYVRAIQGISPAAERIVNKMPYNFDYVGMIHLALPNARVIHTSRDPRDTALSCFSILFGQGQEFAYDLSELGRYIRAYEVLMEHWRAVLPPGVMLDVRYEELVENLDAETRRIVAHCGLEWDDRCLGFYETQRPVATASVNQVRQPIYRSSIGRWRRYEAQLQPLLEALAGP